MIRYYHMYYMLHSTIHIQVNKAVIAVPAKFTPLQRQATGEAFKKAGLKVHSIHYCGSVYLCISFMCNISAKLTRWCVCWRSPLPQPWPIACTRGGTYTIY